MDILATKQSLLLVVLKGFPGSGKSTLGRALSRQLAWPLVDKDDIKDLLDEETPAAGRLAYEIMFNVARRQLAHGLSTICDSPLTFSTLYDQARRVATGTKAKLVVVECVCSDEALLRQRIDGRKVMGLPAHHMTDWTRFQNYHAQVYDQTRYAIGDPHLLVDTTQPLSVVVTEVISWLQLQGCLPTEAE